MAAESKIEWTATPRPDGTFAPGCTFNPWIGCAKVHAGCAHCYAEADMDRRRGRVKWGPHGTRSRTSDAYWKQPLAWDRQAREAGERRRVFCASLADVFEDWQGPIVDAQGRQLFRDYSGGYCFSKIQPHEPVGHAPHVPDFPAVTMADLRRDLFALIDRTRNLDWLLLTKRPENVRRMWEPPAWALDYLKRDGAANHTRRNVWLGYSASDQPTLGQGIGELLACQDLCPVLFLSLEPLLGAVDLEAVKVGCAWNALYCACSAGPCDHTTVDWVIVGGESGPHARPCDLAWVRSLVAQCRAAGVPAFVKQLGTEAWGADLPGEAGGFPRRFRDPKGGDMAEWPADLRVREFPGEVARA